MIMEEKVKLDGDLINYTLSSFAIFMTPLNKFIPIAVSNIFETKTEKFFIVFFLL